MLFPITKFSEPLLYEALQNNHGSIYVTPIQPELNLKATTDG